MSLTIRPLQGMVSGCRLLEHACDRWGGGAVFHSEDAPACSTYGRVTHPCLLCLEAQIPHRDSSPVTPQLAQIERNVRRMFRHIMTSRGIPSGDCRLTRVARRYLPTKRLVYGCHSNSKPSACNHSVARCCLVSCSLI